MTTPDLKQLKAMAEELIATDRVDCSMSCGCECLACRFDVATDPTNTIALIERIEKLEKGGIIFLGKILLIVGLLAYTKQMMM